MSDESSSEDKTEEPTHRKLEEAKKQGQIASSREVANFMMLFALTMLAIMAMPWMAKSISDSMAKFITAPHDIEIKDGSFNDIAVLMVTDALKVLAAPLLLLILAAFASSFLQNGWHVSSQPITPKFSKISPMAGFKRIFSMKSFMEFVKGIIKISIVGYICYVVVEDEVKSLQRTPAMEPEDMMSYLSDLAIAILTSSCVAVFFMAIMDYLYQKWEFMKSMRMTKQEIKDEYKTQEGDPHIKGKLKQIRMEKAKRRMMAAVPTADVVVTNPIHYAIALKYDQLKGGAPIVVAKGVDKTAEKIKEIANDNKVPIVRNPTLARQLHADCDLDAEIPFQHYQAVAEIISYVMKLKKQA